MPLCYIYTTLKDSELPTDLEAKFTSCVAETLNKPPERITVIVCPETRMSKAGLRQPRLLCTIHSISVFRGGNNESYMSAFIDCLVQVTGISPDAVTVTCVDLPAENVKNGST